MGKSRSVQSGAYKSWKYTVIGCCVFTEWVIGSILPMWIMRDVFLRIIDKTEELKNASTL